MLNLEELLNEFFRDYLPKEENIEIYNEFSFQHELGIFLRNKINGYKVQFERNVSFFNEDPSKTIKKEIDICKYNKEEDPSKTIKKEIDICIYNEEKTEKYAIELKFPRNGQVPEQMYSFIKDIKFMEELKSEKFGFCKTACVTLVDNHLFYPGQHNPNENEIYKPFREGGFIPKKVNKPTGNMESRTQYIELSGCYEIHWQDLKPKCLNRFDNKRTRFYMVII